MKNFGCYGNVIWCFFMKEKRTMQQQPQTSLQINTKRACISTVNNFTVTKKPTVARKITIVRVVSPGVL